MQLPGRKAFPGRGIASAKVLWHECASMLEEIAKRLKCLSGVRQREGSKK